MYAGNSCARNLKGNDQVSVAYEVCDRIRKVRRGSSQSVEEKTELVS
jgi:hypothetical protein